MKHLNKICSLLIFSIFFIPQKLKAQVDNTLDFKFYVYLENAPFDSLFVQDYTNERNIIISGIKIKEFTWEITIPNDIIDDSENMVLLASSKNAKNAQKQMIRFITKDNDKKNILVNIGVEDRKNYIYGSYSDTNIFSNEKVNVKINDRDSIIIGDLICIDFNLIIKDPNSDIAVRSEDPFFSWFSNLSNKTSYDSILNTYINISKKHPNSRFLISSLSRMLTRYKSKDDIKKVYENFSDKLKGTVWAKRISLFLDSQKFKNEELPSINETVNEYIIQDSSKYNLIVFSASWCLPCIEEIPILKQINTELGENLILTYISIDNKKGVESFKQLLLKNDIKWRTLFAYTDINKIKEKYFIEGIPYNVLVYPNQDMEIIDVRKKTDILKLYSTIKLSN